MANGLIVADSDLIIDWLRGSGPGQVAVRRWIEQDRLRLTAITAFELRGGADFVNRADVIGPLLRRRLLPLDGPAALEAGRVNAHLRSQGMSIGVADSLQAGICLRYRIALASRNRRHFDRVEGLLIAELND
ncbi:hypothetical protein BH23CHL9_BH23CHL9_00240 [soil metagenome]